jgi:hypothetical protein
VLAHFVDLFFNPSLSDFAFYSITFRLSLRSSLRLTFPDGVFLQDTTWFFSCDRSFCCMEHCRLFSFPVLRNIVRNLRLVFFPFLNSTFKWTTGVFSGWLNDQIAHFVQPLTLPLCGPEDPNDPVLYSAKSFSPFPLLQQSLFRVY